jgi:hypothetical protein
MNLDDGMCKIIEDFLVFLLVLKKKYLLHMYSMYLKHTKEGVPLTCVELLEWDVCKIPMEFVN